MPSTTSIIPFVTAPPLPLGQLPGVRLIKQEARQLHLAYQGSADAVLKWLAQFPVERIATPETSLEEAFIQYYRTDDQVAEAEAKERDSS